LFVGAWWEVDLGEGVTVSRVVIYNRNDGDASHVTEASGRLSNSVVSLLNYQGNTLKAYRIGDATNTPVFDISVASFAIPTASPSTPCSGILVEIKVLTDKDPDETTWSLSNQCGLVRGMSGGPYSSEESFHYVSECLPAGEYKFTIDDSFGDGICCSWGSGSYGYLSMG
jgi:hypothetical protein